MGTELDFLVEQHKTELKSWKDKCDLSETRIKLLQESIARRDKVIVELQIEMRELIAQLADKGGMTSRIKAKDRNKTVVLEG